MKRSQEDSAVIKRLPPFSWLTESQLAGVAPKAQHRTYPARAMIQEAGEPTHGLFVLLSGRVEVVCQDSEGREFISRVVGPEELFGEHGLFQHGGKCIAGARASERCEVLYVPREPVVECFKTNPHAAMCMLETLDARLYDSHRKLAHLALNGVYERVAAALLENCSENGDGSCVVRVGSAQIAGLVGASREMVSRVVAKMVQQGVARRQGRKLIIVDRHALSRTCGHGADQHSYAFGETSRRYSDLRNSAVLHTST